MYAVLVWRSLYFERILKTPETAVEVTILCFHRQVKLFLFSKTC